MTRILPVFFLSLLFFILYSFFFVRYSEPVFAQETEITGATPIPPGSQGITVPNPYFGDRIIYPGNVPVNVNAQVGEFVVNISGFASPNASIVLNSDGQFLRSSVADNRGYFYITGLSVRRGASEFCFVAIDFKRLGESESCLITELITQSRDIKDVFLPPTIGLFRKTINAGEEALIFGYSMPGAKVTTKIRDGQSFVTQADSGGYYEYRYKKVPAGTYLLSSEGEFDGKKSLPPKKETKLEALSVPARVTQITKTLLETIWELLTTTIYGFLLILLILLLIIIILIMIIKPAWAKIIFDKLKRRYPLHHDWLLEFVATNSS